jgi:hypothetical protein
MAEKALSEGYRKPRQLFTDADLLELDRAAVVLAEGDKTGEDVGDIVLRWKGNRLTNGQVTYFAVDSLLLDYDRVSVLWEPKKEGQS